MANPTIQSKGKILLVDDDPGLLRLLSIRLRAEGYDVEAVESAHLALATLNRFTPDLVITDLRMDKMDGIGLLKELQTRSPGLRVVIITAHGTIPDAVVATQSGAFGFLTKPIDKDELMITVEKALKVSGSADIEDGWASQIITRSQGMKEVLQQAKMVAATDARVLVTGDSGTGKELLARAIHPGDSQRQSATQQTVCRDQLQRNGGKPPRVRIVWSRERCVHGSNTHAQRLVPIRRRWHVVARRNW